MKKQIFAALLAVIMLVSLLSVASFAEADEWDSLKKAIAGEEQESVDGVFTVDNELGFRTVTLLKDIDAGTDDVVIAKEVFLDLNGFGLTTGGTYTNNGVIVFHQKNAAFIDSLLQTVPGAYGTKEAVTLPTDENPLYVIPEDTFLTSERSGDSILEYKIASGDAELVWNTDVPAGKTIDVTYVLSLGGNVLGKAVANTVKLTDNVAIGGNNGEPEAVLSVESIFDDLFGDTEGVFNANGNKLTLNKSGKLVVSSNVAVDESAIVSGVEGLKVLKAEDKAAVTVTYYLGEEAVPPQTSDVRTVCIVLLAVSAVSLAACIIFGKRKTA